MNPYSETLAAHQRRIAEAEHLAEARKGRIDWLNDRVVDLERENQTLRKRPAITFQPPVIPESELVEASRKVIANERERYVRLAERGEVLEARLEEARVAAIRMECEESHQRALAESRWQTIEWLKGKVRELEDFPRRYRAVIREAGTWYSNPDLEDLDVDAQRLVGGPKIRRS